MTQRYRWFSIGDINAFNVRHKQETIDSMTDYICGRS